MLKKNNSRALNFVNVLLCGQILLGVIYLAYLVLSMLTATGVEIVEWARAITVITMAAMILGLINRPKVNRSRTRFLTPEMTQAEKVFKLICLGVVDVAACLTVIYLFLLPLEQSELSENSLVKATGCAAAILGVFLMLLLGVPRMRLFRQEFGWALNFVLMALMIGVGWSTAWLLSYLVCGPNGESTEVMTAFEAQLRSCSLTTVILLVATGVMVGIGNNEVRVAKLRKEVKNKTKPKKAVARG